MTTNNNIISKNGNAPFSEAPASWNTRYVDPNGFECMLTLRGETDQYHPCQALADLLTIREHKGSFKGLKVAYAGDVWNVCHSLMTACAMTGMNFYRAHPEDYIPYPEALENARRFALETDSKIVLTHHLDEAVGGADVVVAIYLAFYGWDGEDQGTEKHRFSTLSNYSQSDAKR